MVSIPLPFVVSLLLLVLAGAVFSQKGSAQKPAACFLIMCALTTGVVGLRWLLDWSILRMLQPVLASLIPVLAWYVFAKAHQSKSIAWWHGVMPSMLIVSSLTYPWWHPPIDLMLTLMYLAYGVGLWYLALHQVAWSENIAVSDLPAASLVMRVAGSMLLFSAVIDGALSVDFMFWDGSHAQSILALGHGILLPMLSLAVIWISAHTQPSALDVNVLDGEKASSASSDGLQSNSPSLSEMQATMERVSSVLVSQTLFLDPNLTLAKVARKSGVPSRLSSQGVNQVLQMNVSQWINRYRIEHAQALLEQTDLPVTQIYLDSGFQTKSNFHREFSRQVGCTPSAYRKQQSL